jgi:hypothetical protein
MTTMLTKVMLALGLLAAALAAIEASSPRDGGRAAHSYYDSPKATGGSAGGNLVPLW